MSVSSAPRALEDILSSAGSVEEELLSASHRDTVARLQRLGPLLGEALDWAAENDPERGLALAAALWRYWAASGALLEGRQQLRWLLSLVPVLSQTRLRGLTSSAVLTAVDGETLLAATLAREAMPLARALEDESRLAFLELVEGWGDEAQGDAHGAGRSFESALERFRDGQHRWGTATTLLGLGNVARALSDARASALYSEALALFELLGDAAGVSSSHAKLGLAALAAGATRDAEHHLEKAVAPDPGEQDVSALACALLGQCALERFAGRPETAARLLGQSQRVLEGRGAALLPVDRSLAEREEAELRRMLGPRYEAEWRRGQKPGPADA